MSNRNTFKAKAIRDAQESPKPTKPAESFAPMGYKSVVVDVNSVKSRLTPEMVKEMRESFGL
jgi:hypothetical protein